MAEYDDAYVNGLRTRLAAAEEVCGLVGMTASDRETQRGKALTQSWMEWAHQFGGAAIRVSDERVQDLAERRDRKVEETLARLRRDYPEIQAARRQPSAIRALAEAFDVD